jgi:uncharacterized protein YidB (DUF937 family)
VSWIKGLIEAFSTKPGSSPSSADQPVKSIEAEKILDSIKDYFKKSGGLAKVVKHFEESGFMRKVRSWISTASNQPINSIEALQLLGRKNLEEMAEKAGVPVERLRELLAEWLAAEDIVEKPTT